MYSYYLSNLYLILIIQFLQRLLIQVTELGWNILGTTWALKGSFDCEEAPDTLTVIQGNIRKRIVQFQIYSLLYVIPFTSCIMYNGALT
jgi:hypothetical protein